MLGGALLPLGQRSLSFDELFAAHVASLPLGELLRFVYLHDAHPPLYYLLLKAWIVAFGSGELALRTLSAVAGLVAVGAVARLGSEASPLAGQAAALWLLSSPLFLYASVEATRYALLTALFALAALEVLGSVLQPQRAPWRLAGLLAALLYTHYLSGWLCVALCGFAFRHGSPAARKVFLAAAGISGLTFAPWLAVLWHHLADGRLNPPWRGPLPATLPLQILHLVGFGGRVLGTASPYLHPTAEGWVQLLLALPVGAAVILGAGALRRADPGLAALAAWCGGVPVAVLLGVSLWTRSLVAYPRYFVFTLPFFALAVGAAAAEGARWPWRRRALGVGALAVLLGLRFASLGEFAAHPTAGTGDRKALGAYLRSHVRTADAVVVYPSWERLGLLYYAPDLRSEVVLLGTRRTVPGPDRVKREMRRLAHRERVWVVEEPPMPPGLFAATYRRLARTHRVREFREFEGVRVTLFVRRGGKP